MAAPILKAFRPCSSHISLALARRTCIRMFPPRPLHPTLAHHLTRPGHKVPSRTYLGRPVRRCIHRWQVARRHHMAPVVLSAFLSFALLVRLHTAFKPISPDTHTNKAKTSAKTFTNVRTSSLCNTPLMPCRRHLPLAWHSPFPTIHHTSPFRRARLPLIPNPVSTRHHTPAG